MKFLKYTALTLLASASLRTASAVTLLDGDWKVQMYGFIEQDIVKDSTRSLTEVLGNPGLGKPGTLAGDNGRLMFSNRNSRLGFILNAPEEDGWKTQGRFEFDFLGYSPSIYASNNTPSEAQFFGFGEFRIRLANFTAEKNGLTLYAGQAWSLFGWQPFFVPPTVSAPPEPGALYQRTGAVGALENIMMGEDHKLSVGLSVERPSQADAEMPNLVLGLKYSNAALKSGYTSTYADEKAESLTIGVSAITKQFESPTSPTTTDIGQTKKTGTGVAVDALIPIIPTFDNKPGSSLSFFAEASQGQGYADELPSWTGGMGPMTGALGTGGTAPYTPNLDAGFAGYDSGLNFTLVKLTTWNANLQYHLSDDAHTWFTLGVAHVSSSNVGTLGAYPATGAWKATSSYFADDNKYINVFHDYTKAIRVALEYDKLRTSYVGSGIQNDDRYQASFWYRF